MSLKYQLFYDICEIKELIENKHKIFDQFGQLQYSKVSEKKIYDILESYNFYDIFKNLAFLCKQTYFMIVILNFNNKIKLKWAVWSFNFLRYLWNQRVIWKLT